MLAFETILVMLAAAVLLLGVARHGACHIRFCSRSRVWS